MSAAPKPPERGLWKYRSRPSSEMLGSESLKPTVLTLGPSRTGVLHGAVRLRRCTTAMSSSLTFFENRVVVMYRLSPSFVIHGWESLKGPLIAGPTLTGADHG